MATAFENVVHARVRISIVTYLDQAPERVFEVAIDEGGALNLQNCLNELEPLVTVNGVATDGHSLDVKLANTSWGFDASAIEIVLQLSQWLAGQITGAGFGYAATQAIQRIAGSRDSAPLDAVDREEALRTARYRVAANYEEQAEELHLTEERERSGGTEWEFHFESPTTTDAYTARVQRVRGTTHLFSDIERRSTS